MSIADQLGGVALPTSVVGEDEASRAMTAAIGLLANQLFTGVSPPALSPGAETPVLPVSSPGTIAPPNFGHSSFAPGGGMSTGASLPPFPGAMQTPPIASAPPPKEKDLRSAPTMIADLAGLSSPAALLSTDNQVDGAQPYFLGLAERFRGALPGQVPLSTAEALGSASIGDSFHPEFVPQLRSNPSGMFDAASVRRDFPILEERVHGRRLVWLDNAATTQKPRAVIERISYFYEHENSNIHRAAHALAARATDAYEGAREKTRRFLNAGSTSEIVFTRGTTEAINLVAQSWGRRHLVAGDEIVISWLEHHANIVPWQQLCSEKKLVLRVAPVDSDGQIVLDEYERLLGQKTRLVAFTQVSNALGTITPAREMVAMAHRHGARVLVDGAQAVSHMRVDVQSLDCDFYVFSGHKVFGPTGIGALYGKPEVLDEMPPWQGGGNMIADVTFEKTTYQAAPAKFEAGTGNIADAVGLGAALDYVSSLGLENIARHEHDLLEYGTACLRTIPGLRIIGTAADKAGVLSFVINGLPTEELGGALDREGIAVRSGHHCAQPILRRFGVERTVRASLAPYNTREDIDALVNALRRLAPPTNSGARLYR